MGCLYGIECILINNKNNYDNLGLYTVCVYAIGLWGRVYETILRKK